MEVRIGVVHMGKELSIEVEGSADDVAKAVAKVLGEDEGVLWLTDVKGRRIGVPAGRIGYVEVEDDHAAKRVGFQPA